VSFSGVIDYFSGRPRHPVGADGRMALSDHLRELRARLLKSVLFLVVVFFVALFFYDRPNDGLLGLVLGPYNDAREMLGESTQTQAYVAGATGPLMLQLKLCGVAAIVISSPFWLYQIWAFIAPGLYRREKRWTYIFIFTAAPLFLAGATISYFAMSRGLTYLLGLAPTGVDVLPTISNYLSYFEAMIIGFGLAFALSTIE